jgi:hypothetical protein
MIRASLPTATRSHWGAPCTARTEVALQPTPGKPSDPLAFDAQSARLAVAAGSSVLLYETARGRRLTELPHVA